MMSKNEKNTAVKIVHEAIDERQYVRIKIPVQLDILDFSDTYTIESLSVDGFDLDLKKSDSFELGKSYKGVISVNTESLNYTIKLTFKVVHVTGSNIGFQFVDLEDKKRDVIRYFTQAYLAGEMISANGAFNVQQRENSVKARKNKVSFTRTPFERFKAFFASLLFFSFAFAVFAFVAYKLYNYLFVVTPEYAVVDTQAYVVKMPASANLSVLVDAATKSINTGDPLVTYASEEIPTLESIEQLSLFAELSQTQIDAILKSTQVVKTISSPCDCVIYWPNGDSHVNRFAFENEEVMHLIPESANYFIRAEFSGSDFNKVNIGDEVNLSIWGEEQSIKGTVKKATYDSEEARWVVSIAPNKDLSYELYMAPVKVSINTLDINL